MGREEKETYQVVELDCGNPLVNTGDDSLCDGSGINMFGVKAIAQSRDASSDLIELHTLLAAV